MRIIKHRETRVQQQQSVDRKKKGAGFTFIEILVAGAVIVALAAAAFIFFGGQGTSSELQQLASQIGQKAAAQRRLMDQGLRKGQLSINEFAASVGAVINGTDFHGGTTEDAAVASADACNGSVGTRLGVLINLGVKDPSNTSTGGQGSATGRNSLNALEANSASVTEFQELIIAAIREAVDGDNAKYTKLFKRSGSAGTFGIADLSNTKNANAHTGTVTGSSSHKIYICIDDQA